MASISVLKLAGHGSGGLSQESEWWASKSQHLFVTVFPGVRRVGSVIAQDNRLRFLRLRFLVLGAITCS